jgi:serine/threonine-protein kinase RsbW
LSQISENFSIPSTLSAIHSVVEKTSKIISSYCLPETIKEDICLAVNEAVHNAVIHGNKLDPEKKVLITWKVGREIKIIIKDRGDGFDPHSIDDPLKSKNIFRPRGRGYFFIKTLMDEVHTRCCKDGHELILIKYIT